MLPQRAVFILCASVCTPIAMSSRAWTMGAGSMRTGWKMKFLWKQFGADLRKMREAKNYGLRECADALDIDKAQLCRAEQGRPITVPYFIYLCDWMGSDPMGYAVKRADRRKDTRD
jgi:hypothetical protein